MVGYIAGIKFELPLNLDTLKADRVLVTVLSTKRFGLSVAGTDLVDYGDGYRRSMSYTILLDSPAKADAVRDQILIVNGLIAVSRAIPLTMLFTADAIGDSVVKLLSYANTYDHQFEDGSSRKYTLGLCKIIQKVSGKPNCDDLPFNAEFEIKLDSATKYVTERGVVLKGEGFALERYSEKDPLIPTTGPARLVSLVTDIEALVGKGAELYKSGKKLVQKGAGVVKSVLDFEFSPSGVSLEVDGAAEPNDGQPFDISLMAFQYRPVDTADAPPVQDQLAVVGSRSACRTTASAASSSSSPTGACSPRRRRSPSAGSITRSSVSTSRRSASTAGTTPRSSGTWWAAWWTRRTTAWWRRSPSSGCSRRRPRCRWASRPSSRRSRGPGAPGQPTRRELHVGASISLNTGAVVPDGTLLHGLSRDGWRTTSRCRSARSSTADLDPVDGGHPDRHAWAASSRFTAEFPASSAAGRCSRGRRAAARVFVDQDLLLRRSSHSGGEP